jgi:transcriptional regulator of acetoin/glycerol metabolism
MQLLKRYHWPGNVRELRNFAERIVATGCTTVYADALPSEFLMARPVENVGYDQLTAFCDDSVLIKSALDQTGGNVAQAARLLGRSRSTIYRYLHQRP